MNSTISQILSINFLESGSSFSLKELIGCLFMMTISGLSALVGLGGGNSSVVILIVCFDFMPKQATLIVFSCLLGSSFGNVATQMQRSLDGDQVIKYSYAFVIIPIMFMGTMIGVILNKLLPSIILMILILVLAVHTLPKIYHRFIDGYRIETEQLLQHLENGRKSDLIKETRINPFKDETNLMIFKQLAFMILCYAFLSMLKGSQKFPSLLGVHSYSLSFWILEMMLFVVAWMFFRNNLHKKQVSQAQKVTLGQQLFQNLDVFQENKNYIIKSSICAGIFSGLGHGGGIILVPMFRNIKLNPIQATSTCTFTIFIVSAINVLQALFLGVLSIRQFLFFFTITAIGSLIISTSANNWIRKANRMSYAQLLLLILLTMSTAYLPYALWLKYDRSGRDPSVIFGFGSFS